MKERAQLSNSQKLCRLCFAAMVVNGVYATSSTIIMPLLRMDLGLSYQMGGALLSLLSIGNLLASFLNGVFSLRIGRKPSVLLLTINSAIGYLLIANGRNPALLLLAFFMIGISKGAVYNCANIVVAEESGNKSKGVNILHACYAIGSLLCPFFIVALSRGPLEWRASCYGLAVVALGLQAIFFHCNFQEGAKKKERGDAGWDFLREAGFWIPVGIIFFEISTEVSVTGWLTSYFTDTGIMSFTVSQMMVSFTWGLMMAGRLTAACLPIAIDRKKLMVVMALGAAVFFGAMMFCTSQAMVMVFLALFAFCVAGIQPTAIANLPARYQQPLAMSVLLPLGSAGGIVMPAVTGLVAERIGIFAGMAAIGVAAAATILFAAANCRRKSVAV